MEVERQYDRIPTWQGYFTAIFSDGQEFVLKVYKKIFQQLFPMILTERKIEI
jgi:hypothetical protein